MEVKVQVLALQVVHTINTLLAHQVLGGFGVIAVIALSTIGIVEIANSENPEQLEGYLMWSGIVEFLPCCFGIFSLIKWQDLLPIASFASGAACLSVAIFLFTFGLVATKARIASPFLKSIGKRLMQ